MRGAALACTFLAAVQLSVSSTTSAASWGQFQGDAAHSGHAAGSFNPLSIQPIWSITKAQLGPYAAIFPGAVTDGNQVYISAVVDSIDEDYDVIALQAATGSEVWSQPIASYARKLSAPSVSDGKVYVHSFGHSGISGGNASQFPRLYGLDRSTGSVLFATAHSGQWDSGSRPTLSGAQVFSAGGYYGGIDGYNSSTGAHQWFNDVNQQYGWVPAADSQSVYVYMGYASASPGPSIGTFYAFDHSNGGEEYTITNSDDRFTLYNGTVFLGQQSDALTLTSGTKGRTIVSFNLAARSIRWRTAGEFDGAMAIDSGIVFAANDSELDLLDEATGAKINQWLVPDQTSLTGNLLVSDNLIFLQSTTTTYAVDRATLSAVWSVDQVGDLALGDNLLLMSNDRGVTAFSIATPEPTTFSVLLVALSIPPMKRAPRARR